MEMMAQCFSATEIGIPRQKVEFSATETGTYTLEEAEQEPTPDPSRAGGEAE